MKRLALLAALAFAACSPSFNEPAPATPAEPAPATEMPALSSVATFDALAADGIGPLKIGMTKDEVIATAGDMRTSNAVGIPAANVSSSSRRTRPRPMGDDRRREAHAHHDRRDVDAKD
jgi:hypothetical protein